MIRNVPAEFPVHALPQAVRDAVWEVQRNTQAPLGLIASSALTSMSLAMQGLANVERMNGLVSPLSLWFLTLAESGERKTAVDSKFLGVIREFETEQAGRFAAQLSTYMAAMSAWNIKEKAILRAIKQSEEAALKHIREDAEAACDKEFSETDIQDCIFETSEGNPGDSCCESVPVISTDDAEVDNDDE